MIPSEMRYRNIVIFTENVMGEILHFQQLHDRAPFVAIPFPVQGPFDETRCDLIGPAIGHPMAGPSEARVRLRN
jgi:hypothetical protein